MGIEDFNIDEDDHAESILVVGGTDEHIADIGRGLNLRNYDWQHVEDLSSAKPLAIRTLFDVIICVCAGAALNENENKPEDLLAVIRSDSNLNRSQLIFLHENAARYVEGSGSTLGPDIPVLGLPLEISILLVKVATLLRVRKTKIDQANFESRLSAQNAELRDLNNRFKHELIEAKRIQESLLPTSLPQAPGAVFAAYCVPYEAVGGDLYDVWKIDENRYGLFIGDVTGHGMPAAFIGAMTKMALTYSSKKDPQQMFADINHGLARHIPDSRFVTAALVFFNTATRTIQISRAGHPPPLIYRAETKSIDTIEARGLPLGVMDEALYELSESQLNTGDKLLMVTDGFTETANMDGEMLGVEGLAEQFLIAAQNGDIAHCMQHILDHQFEFSNGRLVKDDTTIVGLEIVAK
jgi:serine phosphatase RsbU (regulator of sigma subunit)